MEKRKPHYDLITAQAIVARDGVKAFPVRRWPARNVGVERGCGLQCSDWHNANHVYKSMIPTSIMPCGKTFHAPLAYGRIAYIKLTLTTAGKVVIQFKEK